MMTRIVKYTVVLLLGLLVLAPTTLAADEFEWSIASQTETTITFQWAERNGAYGFRFFKDDKPVSVTFDGNRTTVKFSKATTYDALELLPGARAQHPKRPTVVITSSPTNPTTDTNATFEWTSTNATSFSCSLDGAAGSACTSPKQYSGLTVGTHSFTVTATGARGTATATKTWSVISQPPPSGSANLYVDTSGGSCTRSATLTAYVDAAACGSFAAAYTAAQSGDTIMVKSGNYEKQFFAGGFGGSQARGTKTLTFRGETGNSIRQIHFGSPNMTFDGINADARGAMLGGSDGAVFENGGEPFTFKNGSIGNVVDQKGSLVDGAGIVFDNVRFHDVVIRTEGVHTECMFAAVPEGMIVRNSRFENCAVMDIFFVYPNWWSPQPPSYGNVVLENNWFGHPSPGYSLYVGSGDNQKTMYGWRVRNNYVEPGSYGVNIDVSVGPDNVFCGNTGNVPSNWVGSC